MFFGEKPIYIEGNETDLELKKKEKWSEKDIKNKKVLCLIDQNYYKNEIIEELADFYNTDIDAFNTLDNWIGKFTKEEETINI